jgi:hypothetical protein
MFTAGERELETEQFFREGHIVTQKKSEGRRRRRRLKPTAPRAGVLRHRRPAVLRVDEPRNSHS